MDNLQDKEPWRKYFTACHSDEVPTAWRSGMAVAEWARHRIRSVEEMRAEGQDPDGLVQDAERKRYGSS